MIAILNSILDFITTVFQWFINTIENTIAMTRLLGDVVTAPLKLYGYVPTFLGVCISVVISVGVIKLILGWGNV